MKVCYELYVPRVPHHREVGGTLANETRLNLKASLLLVAEGRDMSVNVNEIYGKGLYASIMLGILSIRTNDK